MREDWRIKKLGEILKLEYGKPLPDSERISDGKYPIYGANGIKGTTDNYYHNKKTIIIGRKGSAGEINLSEEKFWPLDVTYFVTFDEKEYDLMFLFYLLRFLELPKLATGVKPGINRNEVYAINSIIPLLSEQQRIVAILDDTFVAIARAKANAEQNLKNASELYESYLQGIFENEGKGWKKKKLAEICTLINGRAYSKKELLNHGKYAVLRVGNFFTNNHWYYSDLELPEEKYCEAGDLLYAWSASFGPRTWRREKVIYHYHIWKVIPNENFVTKEFLFVLLDWDKEKIKAAQGKGTTMMHISKGSMEERIIPIPLLEEQKIIIQKLEALSVETNKLDTIYRQKIADLEELKKSLLRKAFSGELQNLQPIEA